MSDSRYLQRSSDLRPATLGLLTMHPRLFKAFLFDSFVAYVIRREKDGQVLLSKAPLFFEDLSVGPFCSAISFSLLFWSMSIGRDLSFRWLFI